ncbi:MAG: hypothetical protein E6K76_02660 [Candidatus Eisenbacteria bacterium]|uniref:O-antigen ligase-related domain-containing protein n=1 Tax=Eiseniibacteriota bacterium TaxID=2212470 RepID=A0A538T9D2_UNCEI|nr:MAG: hypothetical protein E6K76_02660 [Candidatus Eisenbacteria bacterium]
MKRGSSGVHFEETLLLGLLALVPVVFSRLTAECFEIPQTALLTTGILWLAWRVLARELDALRASDLGVRLGSLGRRAGSALRQDPLGASIILFLLSAAASTLTSSNPAKSLHGAPDSTAGLVVACSTAIVYFVSRSVSRGRAALLVRYARAAGFASSIASCYALIQLAGLDPLSWGRTATFGGDVRIFGTLGHPNMLGAYLGMTVPLVLWLAIRARSGAERALWAFVGTISVVVIAATLSRGAWLGLGAGMIAWGLLRLRGRNGGSAAGARATRGMARIPAAVLASLLVLAAAAFFMARSPMGANLATRVRQITSLNAPTTQSRIHIWRAGLRMAHDHPVLGVGLDSFGTVFPRYRTAAYWRIEWGSTPNKAHNEAIQILATQGVAGGIAALLVLLFAARAIWRAAGRSDPAGRAGAAAAGGALVGFAVQDLASFTVVALGSLAAALAGWLSVGGSEPVPERGEAGSRPRRGGTAGWAILAAGVPIAILFANVVVAPIRAQVYEKAASRAPQGSPDRARSLERAAALARWDSRYENSFGSSLLEQALREASAAARREDLRRARSAEERAIRIEPENGYYYAGLGRVQTAQAKLGPPEASVQDVRAAFAEAMARDTVNAQIMDQASNALLELGERVEARSIALHSAALYPELAQPLAFLGYMGLLEGRWQPAADTLGIALRREWWGEKTARAAAWSNLSAGYLALGRNEDARRAAEEALELDALNRDAEENRKLAIARIGAGSVQHP